MAEQARSASGVLLIDKPRGPTSHDVVGKVRRALRTREVGHGGTLDPMATGLLVVLVGTATRLEPYVSGGDKTYETTVRLGVGTDTLDADGTVTATVAAPEGIEARLADAVQLERERTLQVPPSVSAIHVDGRRAHERVRAGETVTIAAREVHVRDLRVDAVVRGDRWLDVSLSVRTTKGYYVRALARDLGESLGLPAHLVALRRVASGAFSVADATTLDGDLAAAICSVNDAVARLMPVVALTDAGAARARQGKLLAADDFAGAPGDGPEAWMLGDEIVAIGRREADGFKVARGFPYVSVAAARDDG